MAKSPSTKQPSASVPASVSVRLKCVYSGFPGDPGPGAIISVDPVEADRLVEIGAADKIDAEA